MLKKLIHDKINEVFVRYQKTHNVISGDIEPRDALTLDDLEEALADLIDYIVSYQPKAIDYDAFTPSWFIYTDSEGIAHSENIGSVDIDKFFYVVSKRIAFDDITDETVQKIYFRGKEVEYAGWQPCMKYEYKDLDGNTVWVGYFPEWDH